MKKILLSITAICTMGVMAHAQQRLALYEEFSGENCGPCAAANPGLNALLTTGTNPSKVLLLKYQTPIPSAGPIYNQNTADVQARLSYYTVPFAPYGRLDGTVQGTGQNAGHVGFLTQADIDAHAAVSAPFNITASFNYSADGDSIYATVTVTATQNYNPAGANLKLQSVFVEDLNFATPPGTNGETEFHHVVRKMYPSPTGTPMANTWTNGQSQVYTISGLAPTFVDKGPKAFMVFFIQNDADKTVLQAMKTPPVLLSVDAGLSNVSKTLLCATAATTTTSTVTIKNSGTSPLTSATIYYKVDNGALLSYSWSGNLASGATASVTLPAVNITLGGHTLYDSVASPNSQFDINGINNAAKGAVAVHNSTANNLPVTTNFENGGGFAANLTNFDQNGNGLSWNVGTGQNTGSYGVRYRNYAFAAGEQDILVLPTANIIAGAKAFDFWLAYKQYANGFDDKLEVVYSSNCGQSWTTLWTQAGASLATGAATTSEYTNPVSGEWKLFSLDATAIPTGSIIGFRATSDFGNNLFLDDIQLRTGSPTPASVATVNGGNAISIYPNPAREQATLAFTLTAGTEVNVIVYDAVGRVVYTTGAAQMNTGAQKVNIPTANLATGLYTVKMEAAGEHFVTRLSVTK